MELTDYLTKLIDLIADDAEVLKCREEVEQCKTIARDGSSADYQLRAFEASGDTVDVKRFIADMTLGHE